MRSDAIKHAKHYERARAKLLVGVPMPACLGWLAEH